MKLAKHRAVGFHTSEFRDMEFISTMAVGVPEFNTQVLISFNKGPFGCNFIFNMEAPYLTDMELKSEYEVVVR